MNRSHLHNTTLLNASFNSSVMGGSGLNYTRNRGGGRGDSTILMSSGLTHLVEPYSVSLPAMVRVALSSFAGDVKQYSCRVDSNGWGWLVSGRKLYVWRHSQDAGKKQAVSCRELILPPSELVHQAKLVVILPSATTTPACLAISPEGHITFWPSIANESNTVTVNADITGQECDSLTSIWPVGCIVTTTSSTVLLIKVSTGRGNKPALACTHLLAQKGWMGGWTKKMTTMLFNPIPSADTGLDNKRVRVLVPLTKDDDPMLPGNNRERKVFIFQGTCVQTWQFTEDAQICLSELNIDENLRRQFMENVWAIDDDNKTDLRAVQTWVLDAVYLPHSKELAVFVAAKSQYETPENLVFGVVTFDLKRYRQRDVWNFIPLSTGFAASGGMLDAEQLYSRRLLATPNNFYVVSRDSVLTSSDRADSAKDTIDSSTLNGPIIGSGNVTPNCVVILVPRLGLLSVKPAPMQDGLGLDDTFTEIRVPEHLALSMTNAHVLDLCESEDVVNRYKSAFLLFLQKRIEESATQLESLFPSNIPSLEPHDPIDSATLAFAEKLIDEAPAADPRWASCFRTDDHDVLGAKSKILIKNFLVDKREGLELFFGFLNNTGICNRLRGIVIKDELVATGSELYNAYEKVYFALSLQSMQTEPQYRRILDMAIRSIVTMRRERSCQARSSNLSPNDIFYKDVRLVHQIIPALVTIQEEDFHTQQTSDVPSQILLTNDVILRALVEVNAVASGPGEKLNQIHEFFIKPLLQTETNEYQVLPWTLQHNVIQSLIQQHEITVKHGINSVDVEPETKQDLIKQLQQLTDIILDGMKTNIVSIQHSEKYPQKLQRLEDTRTNLLRTHLKIGDYNGAALLGEKYLDFEILTSICYDKTDLIGLKDYFYKYDEMEFPEYTWEWYLRQGKGAELVNTFSMSEFRERLGKFLEKYPQIAWHHATANEDFDKASTVLYGLATKEETYAKDKEFLLCMSKLSALSSSENETSLDTVSVVENIDRNLRLLEFQTRIPENVLDVFGMEKKTMRVLSPSEMIDMYITPEVPFEAENFTSAVGLAHYMINEELQMEKRLLIVSRAILRDPWDEWVNVDHPIDVIGESSLYHFLVAAINKGWALDEIYPLPALASFPELRSLIENAHVKFLLKACHEHISTMLSSNDESFEMS